MEAELQTDIVVRPVRDVDAEALGRVHATCWHETYDHLISKAALETATTLLAQGLAPLLRVAGVAPGVTLPSGPMDSNEFAVSHRMTPLGRSSTPEDVARAVRFIIESPAITGTTLLVDGGQHLAAQPRDVMFLAREAIGGRP